MIEEPWRERLHDSAWWGRSVHAQHLLTMFLGQDGSTTRLCEKLTGGPVSVRVVHQETVTDVPAKVESMLPGKRFLLRVATLHSRGHVLLDSLSYIAADSLPEDVVQALEAGRTPIGHLLARLWHKRDFHRHDPGMLELLWIRVGSPDPQSSRSYTVITPGGPCMLVAETFRGGILRACAPRG